ncbi:hypothetical protein L7F22_035001 [Adiantum nelumboides]|nr:hypothetical protein [Adiantum nelumboides]
MAYLPAAAAALLTLLSLCSVSPADAYDSLDPNGNITIKWDVMSWTGDGYVAVVTMYNYQQYRHIEAPGWMMGWAWAQKEVIWSMVGAQATLQGDCSKFHGAVPHSCLSKPTVVDMLPGVPYSQQIANCCKGGVLSSWAQDSSSSVGAFQVSVGLAGTSNKTVKLPKNFTLLTPGPGYTCGPATLVPPSQFRTPDGRRTTQALMTWNVICTYSQFLAHKSPTCCVSLSSFYNETIVPCPTCACACQKNSSATGGCLEESPKSIAGVSTGLAPQPVTPILHCTRDMCPIRVHWHVKQNYKSYWRVKVTISNRNYAMNYSQWNIVVQHPNLNNLTEVFSFSYKGLSPYGSSINNTGMFWGIKFFNDLLSQAGEEGNVQSELLFEKDSATFSFGEGWAFPHKVYFNGDDCVMPPPNAYPALPSKASPSIHINTFLKHGCLPLLLAFLIVAFL